jgi:hypothetical protein
MSPYKPISATEFRVLHLLPGQFGDEIQCVLETRASEVKTRYEALSYQWGDESLANPALRVAHLDQPARKPTREVVEPLNGPFAWILQKSLGVIRPIARQYATTLRVTLSSAIVLFLYQVVPPLFLESRTWILGTFSRHWTVIYICLWYRYLLVVACEKIPHLVAEVTKTKPWLQVLSLPLPSSQTYNSLADWTLTWETISGAKPGSSSTLRPT